MFGGGHAALIDAGGPVPSPAELIGTMADGGAEAIASAGQVPDDELLDRAAMEFGTD
jgi:argininosuccinate synthase